MIFLNISFFEALKVLGRNKSSHAIPPKTPFTYSFINSVNRYSETVQTKVNSVQIQFLI